jgi:hypothetical protein
MLAGIAETLVLLDRLLASGDSFLQKLVPVMLTLNLTPRVTRWRCH